jgi:aryl-alcohol dehydrogenase-like predicted oxidoreductase
MKTMRIPNTSLAPSRLCLGTGGHGTSIPRDEAFRLLDVFYACGGTFLDTAHVYAAWLPEGAGASERTVGAWIRSRGLQGKVVVGTKGGHPNLQTMHIPRLSAPEITHDLLESLHRLRSDRVDLYWLHRDDPERPVGEILGVLNEHLAAGRIGAIGASNWTIPRLREAEAYAREHQLTGFCASQIGWSLAEANASAAGYSGMLYMDDATWAAHRESGLPVVAYSSQANGFFSGKYRPGVPTSNEGLQKLYFSPENFRRLERAQVLAARRGRSANQIALAYLLSQPFPVFAAVGCRTVEQVRASCAAGDLDLSPVDVAYLLGEGGA